ncbi:MAG: hypothetical protein Q8J74_07400 [Candidatus Didemnitutus sp.]|nr:hypothetical protein [Candidatus Didemnitutus sp.]
MYPHRQLIRLAIRKATLRQGIAVRRFQCAGAAVRAAQPLEWLDRLLAFWRRLSPLAQFAVVPLGFLLKRSVAPRPRLLGTLLRWGPVLLGAVRGLNAARPRPRT